VKKFKLLATAAASLMAFASSVAVRAHDLLFAHMSRSGLVLHVGVPRASGIPDYGPSGTVNFDPELYSGKLVEKFYKTTVFGEIASTDYEGEIAGFGAQVKIRTIPDVTVSDYVIGAGLSPQYPTNNSVTLAIDQAKSFAVALSTVDSRQSDLDLADVFANDGSIQLRISADADMLETIPADVSVDNSGPTAGVDSNSINLGDSTNPVSITKTNVVDFIVDCGTVLDEQNVSDEGRWMVAHPAFIAAIKKSDLKIASLAGDGVSIVRNGKVGEIDRFTMYQSRNLLKQTSPGPAQYIMFGHSAGLTFASQIVECQMIDNPNDFGYIIRGLMVFGYEVIGPNYVGTAVVRVS
jgi:opacity protein-like surface antigen